MGYRPRTFRLLAAYHQYVHVQPVAIVAASVGELGLLATGAVGV